ncbi:zinc dependent phospholipase C family protein [Halobacillus litoralis]|uniref:zinc dependent phospholipase C family protein n=1 Tax=Halobacillus litoralis TaxID=45668 RepID=UPI001CD3321A|nr:zinc dependent phospholipase C family protein [Halobacillus litoralis]MCA0970202.1 zinc dependent phospholipase C family protein [Halobacillus litoralis]
MGSRMMHLLIANRICEEAPIQDRTSFLRGSLAPDASRSKERSHFYAGKEEDYSRFILYDSFLKKYQHLQEHDFIKGYYTHLIADHLWLSGFYLSWLRNRMAVNDRVHSEYHHDFRLLNSKLLNHYGAREEVMEDLLNPVEGLPIDEVEEKEIEAFIPSALEDFQWQSSHLEEPLSIFTFDQIIGYIETAVDQSVQALNRL